MFHNNIVFDSTKARVEGTEAAQFVKKLPKEPTPKPAPKKAKWKRDHEQFMAALRSAKGPSQSDGISTEPEEPEDDGLVPCPHCGRRFNDTAATRHIPICKNVFLNKGNKNKPLPSKQTAMAPAKQIAAPAPAAKKAVIPPVKQTTAKKR